MASKPSLPSFMGSEGSSSTMAVPTSLQPISEKLTRANFPIWKALVLSALKGAQLQDFRDGKEVFPPNELVAEDKKTKFANPEYAKMAAREQQVLDYLLSSLSHEMLLQAAAYDTPEEVWAYIMSSFESQSHACVINVCMALSTTRKGDMTISKYVTKMKALSDEMASAGKRLDDEELVSHILAGLDSEFDGVISAVYARVKPITLSSMGSSWHMSNAGNFDKQVSIMQPAQQLEVAVAFMLWTWQWAWSWLW
jgi:hypothetical protein